MIETGKLVDLETTGGLMPGARSQLLFVSNFLTPTPT